jgi:hypothetical protein
MWTSNKMIALYILLGIISLVAGTWLIARKTLRSRIKMAKLLTDDRDINDWLIMFNWTTKILYVPTIIVSFGAAILMFLQESTVTMFDGINPEVIGGVWLGVFVVNFLVEEYNITLKVVMVSIVSIGFFFLWLNLLGWVSGFLSLIGSLALSVSATGYLLISIFGLVTIFISWIQGLFYYITITPNYMNLQEGLHEAGEQISREDYNTRVDTSDFLERLLGFGKIIITFREKSRLPMTVLVWKIQSKALALEQTRGKLAIDFAHPEPARRPTVHVEPIPQSNDSPAPEANPSDEADKQP